MTGTLASRAFFTRFAIFGTDVRQDGRGGQIALVMSSTRSAAPFTGTSTATGAGIGGIGDVGVGAGVAAGCVQAATTASENESATTLRMTPPSSGNGQMVLPNPFTSRRHGRM